MSKSGNNASVLFGSTTYDETDCLQSVSLNRNGNPVTYPCGGTLLSEPGIASYTLTFSVALDATDTAKVAALAENQTGIVEFHPAGDTATYIEYSSTNGTIATANTTSGAGTIITLDVTINLDDVTDGAAV